MRYEVLEHTADLMVKAYGRTLKECFENAAFAMMDQIVDASSADLSDEVIRWRARIFVEFLHTF